jgi:hypothetical protein
MLERLSYGLRDRKIGFDSRLAGAAPNSTEVYIPTDEWIHRAWTRSYC